MRRRPSSDRFGERSPDSAGICRSPGYCHAVKVHRRTDSPVALNGAADWSNSPVETVDGFFRLLNSQPSLRSDLVFRTTKLSPYGGRPPIAGDWAIAYLAFVIGREPAISRWHRQTDNGFWHRLGFMRKPTYDSVHHHFALLEDHVDDFRQAAATLIQKAVRNSGGLVGRDIHVDGTEAETNARIYHDCRPDEPCARRNRSTRTPLPKVSTTVAQTARQAESAVEPDHETTDETLRQTETGRVRRSNGCWYRTADPTAGVRVYKGGRGSDRVWLGYNNLKAIDHYTGAVIATDMINAAENEDAAYPAFLNMVIENTNETPRAIVGDKGYSLGPVFEINTKMGIASVFPWRKHAPNQDRDTVGTDEYDQHGIPRCSACGAPGTFQSFAAGNNPRLWFTCPAGCGRKSIVCSKGWRYLVPLWRTTEAYQALRNSHSNYEKTHWRWRDQWLVAPDNPSGRIRRRGRKCHALRANAAMFIEWLLVCYREGWLGNQPRMNENEPFTRSGVREATRLQRSRMRKGLHLPRHRRTAHLLALTRAGP